MTPYTKKNLLRDIPDAAAAAGLTADHQSRFAGKAVGAERLEFAHLTLGPGYRAPFGHRHAEKEEVYVVLRGTGRIKVEDDILDVAEMDAVRIAPNSMRQFEAGPDGLVMLIFGTATTSPDADIEYVQHWWPKS